MKKKPLWSNKGVLRKQIHFLIIAKAKRLLLRIVKSKMYHLKKAMRIIRFKSQLMRKSYLSNKSVQTIAILFLKKDLIQ